jgi:hypothetical protein
MTATEQNETELCCGTRMRQNPILGKSGMRPQKIGPCYETESHFSMNRKETESHNHIFATIGTQPNYFELLEQNQITLSHWNENKLCFAFLLPFPPKGEILVRLEKFCRVQGKT